MAARLSAFIVWAALAASAVFWGLRLAGASPVAPAHTVPVGGVAVSTADLTRLFGAEPVPQQAGASEMPAPEQSSRFRLIGLAAPRSAGGPGVAVIATDGKAPRAYRIGAPVDGELVLLNVERRAVSLGPRGGPPMVRLELPPLPMATTGTLPPAAMEGAPPAAGIAPPAMPLPQPGMAPPANAMRPMPQQPLPTQQPQVQMSQPPEAPSVAPVTQ